MKCTCVLRPVRGIDQYIPVEDAVNLTAGENMFFGDFTTAVVKDGPSNSHDRTVCDPTGPLVVLQFGADRPRPADGETECVLREVKPGDWQYVPVEKDMLLTIGERLFVGRFSSHQENLGPYGSHQRTICLPKGHCRETVVTKLAA